MFTSQFWKAAAERAAKSAAQALILIWAGDGVFDLFTIDPAGAAGVAAGAAVLSVLTSVVSSTVGASDDPSLITAE